MSVKLIEKFYRNGCCDRAEYWLIDTDAELADLPTAPPGSYAVSAQSGRTYYVKANGEWPLVGSESGGGASDCDWNTMKNKPFGETTVTGDTLTWDGNTEGLESVYVEAMGMTMYNISDVYLSADDLVGGITTVVNSCSSTGTYTAVDDTGATSITIQIADIGDTIDMMSVPTDNYSLMGGAIVLPKKGLWWAEYPISLTINGYNGFETTETVPLPNKYLDIIETVGGDTLTWDGNTSGLDTFGGELFKVSDVTPTIEELANFEFTMAGNGQTITVSSDDAPAVVEDGFIVIGTEYAYVILNDMEGIPKGLYFLHGDGYYTSSLTINGYTGFTKEQVKQEYLPSGMNTFYWDESTDFIYKNLMCTEKVTKAELLSAVRTKPIIISIADYKFTYPAVVGELDVYGYMYIHTGTATKCLYTAEYTS